MMPIPAFVRQQFIRHQGRIELVVHYLAGQGSLQVLNVLNGFFLLRWLSIDEQAKFNVAMGLQASLGILGDLGFGGSLIGLVAHQVNNRLLIGQYIESIHYYKKRLLVISLTIGTLLVFFYDNKQQWGLDFWVIYGLVLISIQAQSFVWSYSAVLQIKGNLKAYYQPQIIASAARLIVCYSLMTLGKLDALGIVLITTTSFLWNAWHMKRTALAYFIKTSDHISKKVEVLKVIVPLMPMVFFYAIQGQVSTFLISFYGKSQNIAEVGALNRLGQLFSLMSAFNGIAILPYFARVNSIHLPKQYFFIITIVSFLIFPLVLIGFYYPSIFIVLLGPKFVLVRPEVGIYILSASIAYIGNLVWSINSSRKWNYWYMSTLYVIATLLVQVTCVLTFDLSLTHNVIITGLLTVCAMTSASIITSIIGLTKELSISNN